MSAGPTTPDFLVIGGGVIGVNVAIELKRRHPDCSVLLIEKEADIGQHASGRNSGVLHAGFYYSADSLKARFCREGNALMRRWCEEHGLWVNACGKLVVARDSTELAGLDELLARGRANGVALEMVSAEGARAIEPRVKTFERALFSPSSASVDPAQVMRSFGEEARRLGVTICTGTAYMARDNEAVRTTGGAISAGYVVNAAGLYADRVAWDFGFSQDHTILPFKGLYLYSSEPAGAFRTLIYGVPNLRNPFLGVHFSVTADGRAKIGPTAIPCLWRENYGGRAGFRPNEVVDIVSAELGLLLRAGFDFRGLAMQEARKYWRPYMVRQAGLLAEGVRPEDYRRWGRPGIRAQLLDVKRRTLVTDFLLEGDSRSIHVLNAVSPAFTSSIPFARHACDEIAALAA